MKRKDRINFFAKNNIINGINLLCVVRENSTRTHTHRTHKNPHNMHDENKKMEI